MKTRIISFIFLFFTVEHLYAEEFPKKNLMTCAFAQDKRLSILAAHPISDTQIIYLQKNTSTELLYADEGEDSSRGGSTKMHCFAKQAVVISGEFTTNYQQSIIVRYNEKYKNWERIDLAERSRPSKIYVNSQEMLVVLPNIGYESTKKFFIYKYSSKDKKQLASMESDRLPSAKGKEVIELNVK